MSNWTDEGCFSSLEMRAQRASRSIDQRVKSIKKIDAEKIAFISNEILMQFKLSLAKTRKAGNNI